jgi:hypothetical protein
MQNRTGWQWHCSISAYLLWRAGESWRRATAADRWDPERWYYLDGLRTLNQSWNGLLSPAGSWERRPGSCRADCARRAA